MPTKSPFEYELTPPEVDAGVCHVTLRLLNIGNIDVHDVTIRLNSTDTYQIAVHGTGTHLPVLRVNDFQNLSFQITAQGTAQLFASVDGQRNGESFHWESSGIRVVVGQDVAQLVSLFALTQPYPTLGSAVRVEATIRALAYNQGLGLEFWADTPENTVISIDKIPTDPIPEGEIARYTAEFSPNIEGIYILHAYLFAGVRRIDHAVEYVSITR